MADGFEGGEMGFDFLGECDFHVVGFGYDVVSVGVWVGGSGAATCRDRRTLY